MKELLLFAAFAQPTPPDFDAFAPPPVVKPQPAPPVEFELRLIGGKIYNVPKGSDWQIPSTPPLNCLPNT